MKAYCLYSLFKIKTNPLVYMTNALIVKNWTEFAMLASDEQTPRLQWGRDDSSSPRPLHRVVIHNYHQHLASGST